PPRLDLWRALEKARRMGELAELHRGIEWERFDENVCYSSTEKLGYRRGFTRIDSDLVAFLPVTPGYVNVEPARLRRGAGQSWDRPKVVVNAARICRGGWRLAAFVDVQGNVCSQHFTGVWPLTSTITAECIASVLN